MERRAHIIFMTTLNYSGTAYRRLVGYSTHDDIKCGWWTSLIRCMETNLCMSEAKGEDREKRVQVFERRCLAYLLPSLNKTRVLDSNRLTLQYDWHSVKMLSRHEHYSALIINVSLQGAAVNADSWLHKVLRGSEDVLGLEQGIHVTPLKLQGRWTRAYNKNVRAVRLGEGLQNVMSCPRHSHHRPCSGLNESPP